MMFLLFNKYKILCILIVLLLNLIHFVINTFTINKTINLNKRQCGQIKIFSSFILIVYIIILSNNSFSGLFNKHVYK